MLAHELDCALSVRVANLGARIGWSVVCEATWSDARGATGFTRSEWHEIATLAARMTANLRSVWFSGMDDRLAYRWGGWDGVPAVRSNGALKSDLSSLNHIRLQRMPCQRNSED